MKTLLLITSLLCISCLSDDWQDGKCNGKIIYQGSEFPAFEDCSKCGQNITWTCPDDCEYDQISNVKFICE